MASGPTRASGDSAKGSATTASVSMEIMAGIEESTMNVAVSPENMSHMHESDGFPE